MGTPTVVNKKRLRWVLYIVAVLFLYLIVNLFIIQIVQSEELQKKALGQWTRTTMLSAARGKITDINGNVLAQSATAYMVLVRPQQIDKADYVRVATELAQLLEMDYDKVYAKVTNTKMSEIVLKRQLSREVADAISELQLGDGVAVATDNKRYYPYGELLSQIVGFTNVDGDGQAGLELSYNKYLSGIDGQILAERDRKGNNLPYGVSEYIEPTDGCDVVLTIDSTIQSFLEKALEEALEVNSATSAQGIIMDATTGAIVAISTQPDYDPNDPPRGDLETLSALSRNRIVTDAYEPGSTFKIITLASALDSGVVNSDSYSCTCPGFKIVNGQRIKCWRSGGHGTQTLTQCAENSCNCAFMDLGLRMGVDKFYDYIYSFGFGSTTGCGLSGESAGIVTHQKHIRDTDLARIGFGQSIAVTPIQLATAVCAAVNGGELHSPYIVDRIISENGEAVYTAEATTVRRVVSEQTSATVRKILESVVENGSGKNAKISGYRIGGKTGTAQKYADGGIAQGKLIASFIGIAPIDNPKYVCLILVDEPQVGTIFGSTVAAPFVQQVLSETLEYAGFPKSGSEQTVTVPNLIGLTVNEAKKKLEDLGLCANYQATDKIVFQVPAPGQSAIVGTDVLLYTENTAEVFESDRVEMISLTGMTRLEALDALKAIGLVMEVNGEYLGGVVTKQSIGFGQSVEVGSTIIVTFGVAPSPTPQ